MEPFEKAITENYLDSLDVLLNESRIDPTCNCEDIKVSNLF